MVAGNKLELEYIEQNIRDRAFQTYHLCRTAPRWRLDYCVKCCIRAKVFNNLWELLLECNLKEFAGEITISEEIKIVSDEVQKQLSEAKEALHKTSFWRLLARSDISAKINALDEALAIIVHANKTVEIV